MYASIHKENVDLNASCGQECFADLCGLVVGKSHDELLIGAAVRGEWCVSISQRGGNRGVERGGGGGGLGFQAVEGVATRCQHHSYLSKEPAPKLILVKDRNKFLYYLTSEEYLSLKLGIPSV